MTKIRLPVRYTGQHFTIDKVLIEDAIIQSAIGTSDTVLDIGACQKAVCQGDLGEAWHPDGTKSGGACPPVSGKLVLLK